MPFPIQVLVQSKHQLLCCATPDAVVRLEHTDLQPQEQKDLLHEYWGVQKHNSLYDFLQYSITGGKDSLLAQVGSKFPHDL